MSFITPLIIAGVVVASLIILIEFLDWMTMPVRCFRTYLINQIKIAVQYWCFMMLIISPVIIHLFGVSQ